MAVPRKGKPDLPDTTGATLAAWGLSPAQQGGLDEPILVELDKVKPQKVRWLWPGHIARGMTTIIAGDPGLAKSFLTLNIAALASRGLPWPDEGGIGPRYEPTGALIVSGEDDPETIIVPRLLAMNADLRMIRCLTGIKPAGEPGKEEWFDLAAHMPALQKAVRRVPNCRLIVIDPIGSYIGSVDSHRDNELRSRVFGPLSRLVSEEDVAVVCVAHMNKGSGQKVLYRIIGSIAFAAAARQAYAVTLHPDDADNEELNLTDKRRLFLPIKANICRMPETLSYRLAAYGGPDSPPIIRWGGQERISAERAENGSRHNGPQMPQDASEPAGGRRPLPRDQCAAWLRQRLEAGPLPSGQIRKQAEQMGFSPATLDRVQRSMSVIVEQAPVAGGRATVWKLPEWETIAPDPAAKPNPTDPQDDDLPF